MPERNCGTCTDRRKIAWGCTTDAKEKAFLDGEPLLRCPRRPLLDDPESIGYIFWLYRQKEKGYLPEPGGLNDQPAIFVQYMTIIDRALDFCREEQRKREEQSKRGTGPRFGRK